MKNICYLGNYWLLVQFSLDLLSVFDYYIYWMAWRYLVEVKNEASFPQLPKTIKDLGNYLNQNPWTSIFADIFIWWITWSRVSHFLLDCKYIKVIGLTVRLSIFFSSRLQLHLCIPRASFFSFFLFDRIYLI